MDKKRLICYVLLSIVLFGCALGDREIEEVKSVMARMQWAKRDNNIWAYVRYFDHGYIDVVHYHDRTIRRSLTKEYARRKIFEWRAAFCREFQSADITRYHVDQPALLCLPVYENVNNFKFKIKNRRTIESSYVVKTMGMERWIAYRVKMTFIRGGLEGEWMVARVERGPALKTIVGDFN